MDEPKLIVVLTRCSDELPEHMTHGKTECRWCAAKCWLTSENRQAVINFWAWPMCTECNWTLNNLKEERFGPE